MFIINQSEKLKGTIQVSGSKNAALPIIAANYLTGNKVKLTNVPDILDVHNLQIVGDEALVNSKGKKYFDLTSEKCLKIRVSILMIPYGLLKHGTVKFIGVGGCNLGKRSLDAFDDALVQCGIRITQKGTIKTYTQHTTPQTDIIQKEFSVTTTEALLTYLAFLPGKFSQPLVIHNAAIEPHVLNVIAFLQSLGANIEINYDHSIVIKPQKMKIQAKEFAIIGDMLEAGLYLAIGAVTPGSDLTVTGMDIKELLSTFTFARTV
jgi:UDP-N-acetylglucosamine 1-carboxyvinyltransferase